MSDQEELSLDLDELEVPSPTVKIFGVSYNMRLPQTFTFEEQIHLKQMANTMQKRMKVVDGVDLEDQAAVQEAVKILEEESQRLIPAIVPDLPASVIEQMSMTQRQRLLTFFMERAVATSPALKGRSGTSLLAMLTSTEQTPSSS